MVSVIIPYNKDRGYLKYCMASICRQTVDLEIIESYSDGSVAYNFNRGLDEARGEYVCFVTEDDMMAEKSLNRSLTVIKDAPWVFGDAYLLYGKQRVYWKPADAHPDFMSLEQNIRKNCLNGGATLYRTDVLREIGGMDESLWTAEEYDMNLKLWFLGHVPKYVPYPLYIHRMWNGQKYKLLNREKKIERHEEIKRIQSFYLDKIQQRDI